MSDTDTHGESGQGQGGSRTKRRSLWLLVVLVVTIALAWWLYQRSIHVYTDDARISTDLVVISSKVAGRIEQLAVKEGSQVRSGELVVQLDLRETLLRREELKAQLKATESTIAQAIAELTMVERQTGGARQAAQSQLAAAEANLASTDSDLQLKAAEWERSQSLKAKGILSQRGWEQQYVAYSAIGRIVQRQAYVYGFQDSFLLLTVVFLGTMIPLSLLRRRHMRTPR